MKKNYFYIPFILLLLIFISASSIGPQVKTEIPLLETQKNVQDINPSLKLNPDYGNIPLYFIPNEGHKRDSSD